MKAIWKMVISIGILIDAGIYGLVNSIYKIYIVLASAKLLSSAMFTDIANRFYAVIGIAMLFFLSYVIIQGIISPDTFSSKAGGEGAAIIKRVMIAVLGIALVPGIFRMAYTGQDIILEEDVIGKIFLGYGSNTVDTSKVSIPNVDVPKKVELEDGIKTEGGTLAAITVWRATFHPNINDNSKKKLSDNEFDTEAEKVNADNYVKEFVKGIKDNTAVICAAALLAGGIGAFFTGGATLAAGVALCAGAVATHAVDTGNLLDQINLKEAYLQAATTGNFMVFTGFAGAVYEGKIQYDFIPCTAVGIGLLYIFLSFSIDMAVRAVKLAYMEIIAPIPLMLQILPKFKDNFQKWLKTTLSLFIEVFLRLTFIYVVLFLLSHLDYIMANDAIQNTDLNTREKLAAQAILIIGLLLFAKTAPQFISETLGISSGNLNLGIRQKLSESGVLGLAAGAAGLASSASQGIGYGLRSIHHGVKKGFDNGAFGSKGKIGRIAGMAGGFVSGTLGGAWRAATNTVKAAPRAVKDAKSGKSFADIGKAAKEGWSKTKDSIEAANARAEARKDKMEKAEAKWVAKHGKLNVIPRMFIRAFAPIGPSIHEKSRASIADPGKYEAERASRALEAKREADNMRKFLSESSEVTKDLDVATAQEELNRLNAPNARDSIARELRRELGGSEPTEAQINRRLAERRNDANTELNNAKDRAISRKLAEAGVTGRQNDVSRRAQSYLDEHKDALKKLASLQYNTNGGTESFGQQITKLFGAGALTGRPSFEGAFSLAPGQQLQVKIGDDTYRCSASGKVEKLEAGHFQELEGGLRSLRKIAEEDPTRAVSSTLFEGRALGGVEYDRSGTVARVVAEETDDHGHKRLVSRDLAVAAPGTLTEDQEVYLADGTKIKVGAGGTIAIDGETDSITIGGDGKKVKMGAVKTKASGASEKLTISDDGLRELMSGGSITLDDGTTYRLDSDGKLIQESGGRTTEVRKTGDRTEVDADTLRELAEKASKSRIKGLRKASETADTTFEVTGTELERIDAAPTDLSGLTPGQQMTFKCYGRTVVITKEPGGTFALTIDSVNKGSGLSLTQVKDEISNIEVVYAPTSGSGTEVTKMEISPQLLQRAESEAVSQITLDDGSIIEVTIDGYKYGSTTYKTKEDICAAIQTAGRKVARMETTRAKATSEIKKLSERLQQHIDKEGK